jgi:glutamate-5-semialdehyde dehydrogenase
MMTTPETSDLKHYCQDVAQRAARAAAHLGSGSVTGAIKNRWLIDSAQQLRLQSDRILAANDQDIATAPDYGLTGAQIDRLRLTTERIDGIAIGLEEVAALPDPVGEIIESSVRPNGLEISKIRVPLGVVFFIYESRPNVTADAAAICLKSGNAVILRGGKEAMQSSRTIVDILDKTAMKVGLPKDAVQLVNTIDRAAVGHFLQLDQYIDVAIPRGGEGLIRRVTAEAHMPVIKHFDGNCHVYVESSADLEMALQITTNSKCQRMGVCNACESLVVDAEIAEQFLPRLAQEFARKDVEIRGDESTCKILSMAVPATDDDFGAEYLGPTISVKVVRSLDDAIEHINAYSSHHTDAIVTSNLTAARQFAARVDSSAVMINASTRFNDGGQFGLGAEIGISTDKFHARGPCGLRELTSYKWVVYGEGQLRS